jgi:signal transduction histidine kinase
MLFEVFSVSTKGLYVAVILHVHLRTVQQAVADLREDQRAAQARRDFLKFVFHELRSPLRSLAAGIDLLNANVRRSAVDQDSLDMMRGAADTMGDTINNFLSLQKIEAGELELDMHPFSLDESITNVLASFSGQTMLKDIDLIKAVSVTVPSLVIGDRNKVEHALGDLVSNAIKFSPECKTVIVTAEGVSVESPASCKEHLVKVIISVRDEGLGISEEYQRRIFNRYNPSRPGLLMQGQGSGLGLTLFKELVSLHGGTVGVESIEGKGSIFHFAICFQVPDNVQEPTGDINVGGEVPGNTIFSVSYLTTCIISCR